MNNTKDSKLIDEYIELTGGLDMKSKYIINDLPRHPTRKYRKRTFKKINKIVVHTTDRDWSILELAEYDINPNHISPEGCPAITYHDVIMKQGNVLHTLNYNEVSYHAGGYNTGSIAVALMYRCTSSITGKDTFGPSDAAYKALRSHCGKLCLRFGLTPDRVFGHRELKGTGWFLNSRGSKRLRKTCPGLQINLNKLREDAARYMQIFLKLEDLYKGPIDGDFGKNSKRALKDYKGD